MSENLLEKTKDEVTPFLQDMLSKSKSLQGAFARIYKLYQSLQTKRFQTQNASEGDTWQSLNPTYEKYKKKRYGGGEKRKGGTWKSWPGNGSKMLIGTGSLAGSVIGPGSPFNSTGISAHRALFTSTSMQISVVQDGLNAEGKKFDYPSDVDEKRPFMEFSDASLDLMKEELLKFIIGY